MQIEIFPKIQDLFVFFRINKIKGNRSVIILAWSTGFDKHLMSAKKLFQWEDKKTFLVEKDLEDISLQIIKHHSAFKYALSDLS